MSNKRFKENQDETHRRKTFLHSVAKKFGLVKEDAPTNSVSAMGVAGIGVGPQGEPGRSAEMMKLMRRRTKAIQDATKAFQKSLNV